MPYVLSVIVGDGAGGAGPDYVYTSDEDAGGGAGLLDVTFQVGAEATADEVRSRDVSLSVAAPFVGATSRSDLPPPRIPGIRRGRGYYRASLSRAGEVVANGTIPLDSIEYEPLQETFTFQLVAAASNDFWNRLGDWSLSDITSDQYDALVKVEMPYVWGERVQFGAYSSLRYFYSDVVGTPVPEEMSVFGLVSLMADAATYASDASGLGSVTFLGQPVLRYSVNYVDDAASPQTITRTGTPYVFGFGLYRGGAFAFDNPTLPAWTAKQLWEAGLAAFGWRLVAAYDVYPSLDITFRAVGDTVPEDTSSFPDLTERLAESGYTRSGESGPTGGFGIRHGGETRPVAPLPNYLRGRPSTVTAGHGVVAIPPPAVANLALDKWEFRREPVRRPDDTPAPSRGRRTRWGWRAEPLGAAPAPVASDDSEPTAEDITDTGFTLPLIAPPEAEGLDLGSEIRVPDVTNHPDYDELVVWGVPVIASYDDEAAYICAVVLDDNDDPRLLHARRMIATAQDGQHRMVNEVWARDLYLLRSTSVSPLEVAFGEFYVHGADYETGNPNRGVLLESEAWEVRDEDLGLDVDLASLTIVRPTDDPVVPPALPPNEPGLVTDLIAIHSRVYSVSGHTYGSLESAYTVLSWTPPQLSRPASTYAVTVVEVGGPTNNYVVYGTAMILSDGAAPIDEDFVATVIPVGETGLPGQSTSIEFSTTADAAVNP